jgi:hypothetical protein
LPGADRLQFNERNRKNDLSLPTTPTEIEAMAMCKNATVLICSLALLACNRGEDSGSVVSGDGDDDDDGYPEDSGPVCDVSQFPELMPEWIVQVSSQIELDTVSLDSLEVTEDALFVAGYVDSSKSWYLERRTLSGELEWSIDLPAKLSSLAWDGSYLYGILSGDEARRWTGVGVEDGWRYQWSGSIEDLAVDGEYVAIVGNDDEQVVNPEDPEDVDPDSQTFAYYAVLTKTVPAQTEFDDRISGESYVEKVVRSPWGDGWIAAGHTPEDTPEEGWLLGLGEVDFDARLDSYGMRSVIAHEDTIFVLSDDWWETTDTWVSSLSSAGDELWHKKISLCGDATGSLWRLAEHDGELWGLGDVPTAPGVRRPLLVRLDPEQGTVEHVYVLYSGGKAANLSQLKVTDSGIYIGGVLSRYGLSDRVVGKVYP